MTFVPVVTPPPLPSARAQELGRRFEEVLRSFLTEHPDTSSLEIRQAFSLAVSGAGRRAAPQAILAAILGVLVAMGGVILLIVRKQGEGGSGAPIAFVVVALVTVALVAAILVLRAR
ncbi:MAG TPA: hypothetical protein VNI57_11705 [Candidatus Saccharimonadales bacterium]|nr:hypothetical protein [Candidatus Saccharimonadales bacterium]